MNLIKLLCEKYKATVLILILSILYSIASYIKIPKEEFPDIKIPTISLTIVARGMTPGDIDRLILKQIEGEFRSLENIDEVISEAYFGMASFIIKFKINTKKNIDILNLVKNKFDQKKSLLPKNIEEPIFQEIDFGKMPILYIGIKDANKFRLIKNAKALKEKLEMNQGINTIYISGNHKKEIEIKEKENKMLKYNISINDIYNAINNNNLIVPIGKVENENISIPIQFNNKITNINDLKKVIIKNVNGKNITLEDIANVNLIIEKPKFISHIDEKEAIVLEIVKQSNANILKLIEEIKQEVSEFQTLNKIKLDLTYSKDSSLRIKDSITDLENNLIISSILVILVVLIFIGKKESIIIGFSIPLSFLFSIGTLNLLGYKLNVVTLFGFILAIGMIVDASIVVVEYADSLIKSQLMPTLDGYIKSSSRMLVPILSATIGIIIVYMPLLFWPGIVGEFMKYIPIVLITVLTYSIISAIIFIPVIAFLIDKFFHFSNKKEENILLVKFENFYFEKLEIILENPAKFLLKSVKIIFSIIILYFFLNHGVKFFPEIEPENLNIIVKSTSPLSINRKLLIASEIENAFNKVKRNINVSYLKIGTLNENNLILQLDNDTIIFADIELKPWNKRIRAKKIISILQKEISKIRGITFEIIPEKKGPNAQKIFEINVLTKNLNDLKSNVLKIYNHIVEDKDFYDLSNSITSSEKNEYNITLKNENLMYYSINSKQIYESVASAFNGYMINYLNFENEDERLPIFFKKQTGNIENLLTLSIKNNNNKDISNEKILEIENINNLSKISKINGFYAGTISSNLKNNNKLIEKINNISNFSKKNNILIIPKGDFKDQKETGEFLIIAFLLALFMKFIILVWQYNSITYTLITLSNVLISISGIFLFLMITFKSFNVVMSGLGIISIAGIVVSSNIIFIDTFQELISKMEIKNAIINTAKLRLRPILMTSITTIIGLIPMVFNINFNILNLSIDINSPSGQWWEELATTVAGGVCIGTISTLTIIPAMLIYFNKKTN